VINSAPQVKMFFHLFSQKLHSGAITSLNVALLYSYGFLAQTLTQTDIPKNKLFRDRYLFHVHARCLTLGERSTHNVCTTLLPIG